MTHYTINILQKSINDTMGESVIRTSVQSTSSLNCAHSASNVTVLSCFVPDDIDGCIRIRGCSAAEKTLISVHLPMTSHGIVKKRDRDQQLQSFVLQLINIASDDFHDFFHPVSKGCFMDI